MNGVLRKNGIGMHLKACRVQIGGIVCFGILGGGIDTNCLRV